MIPTRIMTLEENKIFFQCVKLCINYITIKTLANEKANNIANGLQLQIEEKWSLKATNMTW